MTDPFDESLHRAGRVTIDDAATQQALRDAVGRTRSATPSRRSRRLAPAIALGAALALATPVAVTAAVQWGPWLHVTDPDLVLARSWTDVDGTALGTCESRWALEELPEDVRADFSAYFGSLDVDAIEPHAESVAATLNSHGRVEDIGRLVEGARPDDFDVRHHGALLEGDALTDARALQEGLLTAVSRDMAAELGPQHSGVYEAGLAVMFETQCMATPGASQP